MRVAKVVDRHQVAITRGGPDSVMVQVGDILAVGNEPIEDPEDPGTIIGYVPTLRVKVTTIHERFLMAETYKIVPPQSLAEVLGETQGKPPTELVVTVNIGDPVERLLR